MPDSVQRKFRIKIGRKDRLDTGEDSDVNTFYPEPIVNESESAKEAKSKVAAIRKMESTIESARQVVSDSWKRNAVAGLQPDTHGIVFLDFLRLVPETWESQPSRQWDERTEIGYYRDFIEGKRNPRED